MATVAYSAIAKADLREIWDYVSEDSQLQADRLIERFRSKLEHLAQWNTLGRPRPEIARNCRSYPFGQYCFFYRPSDNGIEVIRVIHSARDLDQIEFLE
ncbi:type II toxin-antitoxin system RelE/ParE family toxin [Prosthecobacter sp.]|uniref:type II toxin-antitoxin system RelE/ParE family toxin n=1 Tax=Prosthecobacter sp. TaxID=1965333 RepID=UPI002487A215|nr:type II toxin-antitoxin system RelE/ParE family toxin [Prosthecobacter sp.]MDI1310770.1 type II toxin-antitoxin system RelE/ParE family toxin [Prosthecobacter sp.]